MGGWGYTLCCLMIEFLGIFQGPSNFYVLERTLLFELDWKLVIFCIFTRYEYVFNPYAILRWRDWLLSNYLLKTYINRNKTAKIYFLNCLLLTYTIMNDWVQARNSLLKSYVVNLLAALTLTIKFITYINKCLQKHTRNKLHRIFQILS